MGEQPVSWGESMLNEALPHRLKATACPRSHSRLFRKGKGEDNGRRGKEGRFWSSHYKWIFSEIRPDFESLFCYVCKCYAI